jgi:hypothetical protein
LCTNTDVWQRSTDVTTATASTATITTLRLKLRAPSRCECNHSAEDVLAAGVAQHRHGTHTLAVAVQLAHLLACQRKHQRNVVFLAPAL